MNSHPKPSAVSSPRLDVDPELMAMQRLADVLGAMDGAARTRVLRWAVGRFADGEETRAPEPAVRTLSIVQGRRQHPHSGLEVAGLEHLFDEQADDEPLDAAIVARVQPPAGNPDPATTQPVVSMLHGFVEDFRRLAREWERG